jgi:hypothetical protein
VGHPFVSTAVLIALATTRFVAPSHWLWAIVGPLMFVIVPLGWFMGRQVRRGRWQNVDASQQTERPALYLVAIIGTAILILYFMWIPSLRFLWRGALVLLVLLIAARVANRWIKLSLHVAYASAVAILLLQVQLQTGLAFLIFVPILAWARLVMRRHSLREVLAGFSLGTALGLAVCLI